MAKEKFEMDKLSAVEQEALVRTSPAAMSSTGYGYGYGHESQEQAVNVRDLWRIVRKHRMLIAILSLIVTTIVTVEVFRSKTVYQSTATVEIGRENAPMLVENYGYLQLSETESLKTKILFIKSRPLLEDVIVNLKLDQSQTFLDITERRSIVESLKTFTGRVAGSFEKQEVRSALPIGIPDYVSEGGLKRSPDESARLAGFVNILRQNISTEEIPDTRAINISFTHTDPVLAATITNGIAAAFTYHAQQIKTEKFSSTSDWLTKATDQLKAKMQKAEQDLANYMSGNNLYSTDGKGTLATDKLVGLHAQVMKAETDRLLKQSLYEEVRNGRVAQLPEAFSDTKTVELQKNLGDLRLELSRLNVTYGPDNPQVVKVQQQIAELENQLTTNRRSLEEKLAADYQRAVRDEASLKTALERAKTEASRENQAQVQFNIYKQNVDTATTLYNDFLQKSNQANLQKAEQTRNFRIIEPGQFGTVIGPKRLRAILIAVFLSLIAGIGLAFFIEYLDNTVKTIDDVNRYTGLPTLAVIPVIGTGLSRVLGGRKAAGALGSATNSISTQISRITTGQVMAKDLRSAAAEAYRVLRTGLLLSSAGHPPKKILITSANPGEGKTTTIVNTGISLAQLGASVLIIDCDLRKPSVHKVFGANYAQGVSTYLSREIPLASLIQETQIPNLSLLPCGAIPPNPAELLSSDKMKTMLRMLEENYDHILIDSPPLINVADPVVLSTLVDGVVMVIHGGKSTRESIRRARNELAGVNAKVFGAVLNNLDLRKEGYGDYYYYYYNNYTYGKNAEVEKETV